MAKKYVYIMVCPDCDEPMEDVNEGYFLLRYGDPAWECKNPECPAKQFEERTNVNPSDKQDTFTQLVMDFEERGKAYFDGEKWVAEIDGGWWVAFGKTRMDAVRAVLAKYEQEPESTA